mmetsp:Transcript_9467/g.10974  ORF Transcript_9467/g.10974 Transcript_9467/m.10974 type:complete len:213 (-) Transcript_9467:145-783(-)|eukprot:CAMPEP_0197849418 /NCGR_PEP_ID=MMETSP1438-20131217/12008_1 /TAXON_ID=1461541 /ORGANISM="Pterosperma sp., Strain CCMP1384" /LENGTH=212 /DNA_ID=CAMNT_0043462095 /DNA_START=154 /DNA_END=792 /DNA_ORIENTATION=+
MEVTGANRYNPELLPELEQNVETQVQQKSYNLDANLCLLRLYQFYPDRVNGRILLQLLLKSLMALPSPDYDLCVRMVPERLASSEPFARLSGLARLLQSAQFREFWALYAQMEDVIAPALPSFAEAARNYIVSNLTTNYQKCPLSILSQSTNLEGHALEALINQKGWVRQDGTKEQVVKFPENECNAPVAKKTAEQINFDQVSACMAVAAAN